jgi:hypothetical protein
MGWAGVCCTYCENNGAYKVFVGNLRVRDQLEDLDVDGW